MKIFRKKEIIAAVLVVLIGCAGYLNWSYQDTVHVTDNDSYVETGKRLGEAQYVNSDVEVDENDTTQTAAPQSNAPEESETASAAAVEVKNDTNGTYFENARYEKENSRSKSMEILNQTASNESFDSETRKKAGDKIIAEADNVEKEQEIESIAQSKGYSEVCAYVTGEKVNIMVRKDGFGQEDVKKLTEIATDHMEIAANAVKIIQVK